VLAASYRFMLHVCQVGTSLDEVARAIVHPVVVATGDCGSIVQAFLILEGQVT